MQKLKQLVVIGLYLPILNWGGPKVLRVTGIPIVLILIGVQLLNQGIIIMLEPLISNLTVVIIGVGVITRLVCVLLER